MLAHSASVHILHDEGRLTLASILGKRVYYGRSLPAFAAAQPWRSRRAGQGHSGGARPAPHEAAAASRARRRHRPHAGDGGGRVWRGLLARPLTAQARVGVNDGPRRLLWASLADERPRREAYWLSLMPGTEVTVLGDHEPYGDMKWVQGGFRRPVRRFVEAGALAWQTGLDAMPTDFDWCASLELCSLVTGQVSDFARRHRIRQAVVTWENDPYQPLYRLPPYRQAMRRALDADLFLCLIEAARTHLLHLGVPPERIVVVNPGSTPRPGSAGAAGGPARSRLRLAAGPQQGHRPRPAGVRAGTAGRPGGATPGHGRGPLEGLVRRSAADPTSGVTLLRAGDADASLAHCVGPRCSSPPRG